MRRGERAGLIRPFQPAGIKFLLSFTKETFLYKIARELEVVQSLLEGWLLTPLGGSRVTYLCVFRVSSRPGGLQATVILNPSCLLIICLLHSEDKHVCAKWLNLCIKLWNFHLCLPLFSNKTFQPGSTSYCVDLFFLMINRRMFLWGYENGKKKKRERWQCFENSF